MTKNLWHNLAFPDGQWLKTYTGGSGTGTIKVAKDSDALYGAGLYDVGDYLRAMTWTSSGLCDVWFKVTARDTTGSELYDAYTVTVLGGTDGGTSLGGVTLPKGTAIVSYGQQGDGVILLSSDGYRPDGRDAPFIDVLTHTEEDEPWDQVSHVRLGHLLGVLDIEEYAETQYDEDGEEIVDPGTWGLAVGHDLSDTSQPYAIFSNKYMRLQGVQQEWTNLAGKSVGYVNPSASGGDVLFGLGKRRDEPDFWVMGDGTVGLNRLVIQSGEPADTVFNSLNGAFLLGPRCPITTTSWTSTRGLAGTISGAFQQVAGPHENTRALMMLYATTNQCTNPIFHTDDTGWAYESGTAGEAVSTYPYTDDNCCRIRSDGTVSGSNVVGPDGYYQFTSSISKDTTYSGSVWVRTDHADTLGQTCYIEWQETGGATATQRTSTTVKLTGQWQRAGVSHTILQADRTAVEFHIRMADAPTFSRVYFDGATLLREAVSGPDIWGSLDGVDWDGAEYGSTSTISTSTSLNLSSHAGTLLDNQDQLTFWLNVRMPRSYTEDDRAIYLWDVADSASTINRYVAYINTTPELVITYRNQTLCQLDMEPGNLTWRGGDWVNFAFVHDFEAGTHKVYADGKLIHEKGLSVPAFTGMDYWRLGDDYNGGASSDLGIYEAAVFYSALGAADVADLAARSTPLSDGRATEKPGIYILDGSFTLASSTDAQHMELDSSELAAYDSSGNKDAWFDEDGLSIVLAGSATPDDINKIKWVTTAGTEYSRAWVYDDAGADEVALYIESRPGEYAGSAVYIQSVTEKNTGVAKADISATTDNYSAALHCYASESGSTEYVETTTAFRVYDQGIAISSSQINTADGSLMLEERSSDPDDPAEGHCVLWQSNGTGAGDDGDIMMKITAGGSTKTATLIDFSGV